MIVKKLVLGDLEANCYVLINNNDCLLIDPASDYDIIEKNLNNLNVLGILITHYHFDHIGALKNFEQKNIPIYDYKNLGPVKIKDFEFDIILNKGHTSDSVSFYFKKYEKMFVGDFIFLNDIGRTDLETGSYLEMQESIKKISQYSENIIIYPGHGPSTTLEYEKKYNPYFSQKN